MRPGEKPVGNSLRNAGDRPLCHKDPIALAIFPHDRPRRPTTRFQHARESLANAFFVNSRSRLLTWVVPTVRCSLPLAKLTRHVSAGRDDASPSGWGRSGRKCRIRTRGALFDNPVDRGFVSCEPLRGAGDRSSGPRTISGFSVRCDGGLSKPAAGGQASGFLARCRPGATSQIPQLFE